MTKEIDHSTNVQSGSSWIDNAVRPPDEITDGTKKWFRWKGDAFKILHNVNGPAIVFPDGEGRWYEEGFPVDPRK